MEAIKGGAKTASEKKQGVCIMYRGIPIPLDLSEVEKWEAMSRPEKNRHWKGIKKLIDKKQLVVVTENGKQLTVPAAYIQELNAKKSFKPKAKPEDSQGADSVNPVITDKHGNPIAGKR